MQLSTASAGIQAVMSEDNPFLGMVFRGHARRTLPTTLVEKIDEVAANLSEAYGAPIEGTTNLLFDLAMEARKEGADRD